MARLILKNLITKYINMGRYINTIYGREYKSDKQEDKENLYIVIVGLIFIVITLIWTNLTLKQNRG